MLNRDFRKVKNISKDMEENYKNYFFRNTSKFFSKWKFTENDLGTVFTKDEEDYQLMGQVTESVFFFKKLNDDSRWFVSSTTLKESFERKDS